MKFFTRNGIIHKIIISVSIVLVTIFSVPQRSYGGFAEALGSTLLKELLQLVSVAGDIAMGLLNSVMLGTDGVGSAMLPKDDVNLKSGSGSWLYLSNKLANSDYDYVFEPGRINTKAFKGTEYEIPNMLYSPENIFANKIAALDVNFLRRNEYQEVTGSKSAIEKSRSAAGKLSNIISSWYKSFRNIAIVGLLSVLIYLGIRITISSTAVDKAKYKENMNNWFVALCLVFVIHFIMSGILMLTDKVTEIFDTEINNGIKIKESGENIAFKTNLTGLVRFRAQSSDVQEVAAYTVVYVALVFYTYRFTFLYFKRFLYMAFFTMIAPLVALTYPIDKMGDGQAQAFNLWFKEYTMNAIIQPVHLILYTVFVTSSAELAQENVIYALVAIGFLIPAEKFIKSMFKLDKASTPSGLGSFAGGALAMQGLNKLGSLMGGGHKKGGSSNGDDSGSSDSSDRRIRMQERPTLGSFGGDSDDEDNNNDGNDNDDYGMDYYQHDGQDDGEGDDYDDSDIDMIDPPIEEPEPYFEGQDEMDRLGEELDQYDNNDIYMNPELGAKQMRYQELDAQKRQWQEDQERQNEEQMEDQEEEQGQAQLNVPPRGYDPAIGEEQNPEPEEDSDINADQGPQELPGWKKKLAIKGAKSLAKGTWKATKGITKFGLSTAGTVAGATIGFGAGIATGEGVFKAAQYAATGGAFGRSLGKNVGGLVDKLPNNPYRSAKNAKNKIIDKKNDIREMINEQKYGTGYARQQRAIENNELAKKDFMNNKKEKSKYQDMAARIYNNTGKSYSAKDLMNASYDYQQAGITDEDDIERGLTLEANHGGINGDYHQKTVDVMDFARSQSVKKDSITDEKKRTALEGVVQSKVRGTSNQLEVMNSLAEAYGLGDYYKKVGKIGKPATPPQQTSQTGAQGQAGSNENGGTSRSGTQRPTGTRGRSRGSGTQRPTGSNENGGTSGSGTQRPTGTRGRPRGSGAQRPAGTGGNTQPTGSQNPTGANRNGNPAGTSTSQPNGGAPTGSNGTSAE